MYTLLAVCLPVALVSVVLAVWFVPSRGAGQNLLLWTWLLVAFTVMTILMERARRSRIPAAVYRIIWLGVVLIHPLMWLGLLDGWAKHRTVAWILSISPGLSLALSFFAAAAYVGLHPMREGHCVHCNYDLTGNTSGICPECGKAIEPVDDPAERGD